jgi:hypothetical protein
MNDHEPITEFERRTRAALRDSVEHLDARTRSKLNQARQRALDAARQPAGGFAWGRWAPVGAVAMAVLASLLIVYQGRTPMGVNDTTASALDDLELLVEADVFELTQEDDYEFIEWASNVSTAETQGI